MSHSSSGIEPIYQVSRSRVGGSSSSGSGLNARLVVQIEIEVAVEVSAGQERGPVPQLQDKRVLVVSGRSGSGYWCLLRSDQSVREVDVDSVCLLPELTIKPFKYS